MNRVTKPAEIMDYGLYRLFKFGYPGKRQTPSERIKSRVGLRKLLNFSGRVTYHKKLDHNFYSFVA
jgi:hypothetical protein